MHLLQAVVPALLLGFAHALEPAFATVSGNELLQDLIRQAQAEASIGATPRPEAPKAAAAAGAVGPLDAIIDFVLAGAIPHIISHNKAALPVPDFNFHFNTTLGNEFRVAGGVSASGGELRDLTSLFRQGPAVLRRAPGGLLLLEAAAGIRELRLRYAKYSAALDGPLAAGQAQLEVSPAVMSAQIALVPPCSVQLRQLRVSQLGPLRVSISGLPAALSGLPQLLESVLQSPAARQRITGALAQRAAAAIAQELKRVSC